MNNVSRFTSPADDELEQIVGGAVSCEAGLAVMKAYGAAGKVMEAVGYPMTANYFYGMGDGAADASCYLG